MKILWQVTIEVSEAKLNEIDQKTSGNITIDDMVRSNMEDSLDWYGEVEVGKGLVLP
jgi:hypothetical protein